MTERVNLVDAYDNRSVIAKMVNMEERVSGAETSVKASAEAAASSASAAAASQTAARTSENNAAAAAASAAATLADTVGLSSKQTVTGAKTFAGDTTVTGSFVTSGNAEMASLDIDTGTLTVGSGGTVEINGALTASNTANVITAKNLTVGPDGTIVIEGDVTLSVKSGSITLASGTSFKSTGANVSITGTGNHYQAANHDSVLQTNDILTAKDINQVNGIANNLVHRSGNEPVSGLKTFLDTLSVSSDDYPVLALKNTTVDRTAKPAVNTPIGVIAFYTGDGGTPYTLRVTQLTTGEILVAFNGYTNKGTQKSYEICRIPWED